MKSRRSSRRCADGRPAAGFSLVELLVVVGVLGTVMLGVVQFFSHQAHGMRRNAFRIETQQALRGALDAIARDVRLAGACLPTDGAYVAIEGTSDAQGDSITVRTGLTRDNLSCISSFTTANAASGTSTFQVNDGSDFVTDKLAYVRDPNGSGEFFRVTGHGPTSVSVSPGSGQIYPSGSRVYAVDERMYTLDSTLDPPVLFLTVDQQTPQPFAAGIRMLDILYVLDRNCPTCDVVDPPDADETATWWLVNEVIVSARAETVGGVLESDDAIMQQTVRAKPRNLMP